MSATTESSPLARARSIVLAVLTVDVLVLLLTGVALFFVYRPSLDPAFARFVDDGYQSSLDFARTTTTVHRLAA